MYPPRRRVTSRSRSAWARGRRPTPIGVFYTKELLQPPNPNTAYGAYAYGLSGYSNVLTDFAGGDGVVGIHGTNDPSTTWARTSATAASA